jgi:single-strand DNA-binding protein
MALPIVSVEGGLIRDPELRFSGAGKPWAAMRIVAKDRKNEGGTWVDGDPTFLDVVCFGKVAENVAESLQKGDAIVVVGRMKEREWTTDSGDKRTSMQLVADVVGAALTFHPVKIMKAERAAASTGSGDPWGAPEEPPF